MQLDELIHFIEQNIKPLILTHCGRRHLALLYRIYPERMTWEYITTVMKECFVYGENGLTSESFEEFMEQMACVAQ